MKAPEPKLKPGVVYIADNGMLVCHQCAGYSARTTGRDTSGQALLAITSESRKALRDASCECGATTARDAS